MSISLKLTLQIDKDRPTFDAKKIAKGRNARKHMQVFFLA